MTRDTKAALGVLAVLSAVLIAARWWWGKNSGERNAMKLRYFKQADFGPYWPLMSKDLLVKLDEFRHRLGYPVAISPAPGSIGRPIIGGGETESSAEKSYHNYLIHGEVKAIDVMPMPPLGATTTERRRWVETAQAVGFTGIGLYPDWKPRVGLHLDVRPTKLATWAGVRNAQGKQVYVNISEGYV